LVFSHQINFGQRGILKYLILGNLFVLVHFVSFNRFTLRFLKLPFYQFYFYFFASKSEFHFLITNKSNFIFKTVQCLFNFKTVQSLINCSSVPSFYIIADWSLSQKQSKCHANISSPHVTSSLDQMPHGSLNSAQCQNQESTDYTPHHTNRIHSLSLGSYGSKSTKFTKISRTLMKP